MSVDISEADWKLFVKVKKAALDRRIEIIVGEIGRISGDASLSFDERYRKIWGHMKNRDKEIANAFDGHSRSNAFIQLFTMKSFGMIGDEELAGFSEGMRNLIDGLFASREKRRTKKGGTDGGRCV